MSTVTFELFSSKYNFATKLVDLTFKAYMSEPFGGNDTVSNYTIQYSIKGTQSGVLYKEGSVAMSFNTNKDVLVEFVNSNNDTAFNITTNTNSGNRVLALNDIATTENYTTWLSSSFGTDVKLVNGTLTGTVFVNKTSSFNPVFDNETFVLYVQAKYNNVVVDLQSSSFFLGSSSQITKPISLNANYPEIIVEAFVWNINNDAFSPVQAKILYNQITSEPVQTVPNAPSLTNVGFVNQTINLSWNNVTNATDYNLEGKSPSSSNFISLFGDITGTTLNIPLTEIGSYQFRVRAKNNAGYSLYSNIVGVSVSSDPVTVQPNTTMITLGFSDDFKMLNDIITGSILVTKTSSFDPYLDNQALTLWLKFITNGNVQNITSINIQNASVSVPITKSILQPNVLIEAYVWDSALRSYSIVYTKSLTNETTVQTTTQKIVQIMTPNNANMIRGIFNPQNYEKWIYDNVNSLLCNYPEFQGLNVPCSLSYNVVDGFVSDPDNFGTVIESIRLRYSGVITDTSTNKNLISMLGRLFAMGTGLGLLVSKK